MNELTRKYISGALEMVNAPDGYEWGKETPKGADCSGVVAWALNRAGFQYRFWDVCPNDAGDDSDGDGSCDSADLCTGKDTTGDTDGDGKQEFIRRYVPGVPVGNRRHRP